MSRDDVVRDWLAKSAWADWNLRFIAGDASARRYARLSGDRGHSVILMDAPMETCGSQRPFVQIAKYLIEQGLSAPHIYEWDDTEGLLVLEDLGSVDMAAHLSAHPSDTATLYNTAIDVLKVLHGAAPPPGLKTLDAQTGADMIDLAFDWTDNDTSRHLRQEIKVTLAKLMSEVCPNATVLALRDYHAENLIWRETQSGMNRLGLLDFQDAIVAHPAYDLASLLRDARRDVDPMMIKPLIRRLDPTGRHNVQEAFHVLAIQRNLRIMGIFNRLACAEGKTAYLSYLPRVQRYLIEDLATPVAAPLAPLVHAAFELTENTA